MSSHSYIVKVRSSFLLEGKSGFEDIPRQQNLTEQPNNSFTSEIHQHATYLWGGSGLLIHFDRHGTGELEAVSPAEELVPPGSSLTVIVDLDGTAIDLFACSSTAQIAPYPNSGVVYLGRLRQGQAATFRLDQLHGVAALCNDPIGSDSKVTCVLAISDRNS